MMISRDNINNYVRNLCSGDYLAAFSQFSSFYMFVWFTLFRFNNVAIYASECVSMLKCTGERPLFPLPFAFSHYYIVREEEEKNRHESDKKHCV